MRADDSRLEAAAPPGKAAGRQDWLRAARAAGLTPLAALMAVAHICPSHRARQTPLDGQGRRRSEWGFRRRRPARGSQRAASRPMYRRPPLKSSSIRRWHVSPITGRRLSPRGRRSFLAGFTSAPPESPSLRSGCRPSWQPLPWRRVRGPVPADVFLPRHRQLAPPIGVPRCLSPQLGRRRVVMVNPSFLHARSVTA